MKTMSREKVSMLKLHHLNGVFEDKLKIVLLSWKQPDEW